MIGYYAQVAPALLPHVAGRAVTRKRWPDGVDAPPFFAKNMDPGAPSWVPRATLTHKRDSVTYPLVDSPAVLTWLAQSAALELHVPQWRVVQDGRGDRRAEPDRVVFDLDPGPGVGLVECAEVARILRQLLLDEGFPTYPVTSGSKGLHLYAAVDGSRSSDEVSDWAHGLAETVERERPDLVVSRMAKALRPGKVFIDWSQNNAAKTTIAPYSLRGRDHPTVAAPRTWDELDDPDLRHLDHLEVLDRLARDGDLLAALDGPVPATGGSAPASAARGRRDGDDGGGGDGGGGAKLDLYRAKRSADRTPEPVPERGDLPRGDDDTFVIQEHHATALHWDFRLERDGVLVSWALPRGIPTDTRHNRLAVHTEDHPLEYADFAGDIPEGEYGGGGVTIWDSGRYETEKWRDDEVIVVLHGRRATGRFALIRTRGSQWLMHRTRGQEDLPAVHVRPGGKFGDDRKIIQRSGGTAVPRPSGSRSRRPAALPEDVRPMLATAGSVDDVAGGGWRFEGKWDGFRAVAVVGDGPLRVVSRNDKPFLVTFPELKDLDRVLAGHVAVLDGEIVALDEAGRTDFASIQQRANLSRPADVRRAAQRVSVQYWVFDVLFLDGVPMLERPYDLRRQVLEALAPAGDVVRVPPQLDGDVEAALAHSRELRWEGVMAKRADSTYQPGRRSRDWLKIKNQRTQEVVVVGWRPGAGRREGGIGALLLAIPDGAGGLDYAGRVGTGFSDAVLADLLRRLTPLARRSSPVTTPLPTADVRDARWVEPELVGEVVFAEWTRDGILRQPSWRGLRPDKDPDQIVRES
ncbi:ATP-dependent DNA ligase [Nakamurella endophytica]|uniref:DNA ligase (ATP) n=1 Tax=Nakamurella endophytica TaxID=1748367 RepID=A0A917SW83_9ACTN|nr:ATP-dependent DNA ligase [Nakamurella endophytica]